MTLGPVLSRSSELQGKYSIQMVRMCTLCTPALIYLDHFTDHDRPMQLEEECDGNISATQNDMENHDDVHHPKSLLQQQQQQQQQQQHQHTGMQQKEKNGGDDLLRITLPSDLLWACEDQGLISAESIAFILTTTARPNTLLYYTHVKFLSGLKTIGPMAILAFIGRYYCLRKRKEHEHDYLHILNSVREEDAMFSLGKDPRKWSVDVRNDMRSVLGNDISTIVTNLTKLI